MKKIYSLLFASMMVLIGVLSSCKDFNDINKDPYAANAEQVEMEYFINNSIISAQQDPHIAERAFVLYWKDAGHMDRVGTLSTYYTDDGWSTDYFNYLTGWITNINAAISLYEEKQELDALNSYSNNLLQVARIWRVYLMSEFTDNFGAMPINGFQGEEVYFNTVEELYNFFLAELKEAVNQFDGNKISGDASNLDPAYSYDFEKWKRYGNSMRMRLAMRLSEANPTLAQKEFEDAVKGTYISELAHNFSVQEKPGWDALTGVMTREWNMQYLSTTLNNLYSGLGGITSETLVGKYAQQEVEKLNAERVAAKKERIQLKFNDEDWLGVRWPNHFSTKTNDPMAGYWNDGLNHIMDPRAYKAYNIPGDVNNPHFNKYPSWSTGNVINTERALYKGKPNEGEEPDTLVVINSAFTWNAPGLGSWGEMGAINMVRNWPGNTPRLVNEFRNSSRRRVFFGSWESYFLIAEASVRGWSVPMSGKEAYEKGITESFNYWDSELPDMPIKGYLTQYLASTSYNRAGTSVSWDHTTEPAATVPMRYLNGMTQAEETVDWSYATNNLYKNGSVRNDHLTKIITQKFIAQVPWLPLETWSDHRRLGLPFFENPIIEKPIESLPALTTSNYMESRWEFFPQRLKYPSSLRNNSPVSYEDAVSKLGGPDEVGTKMFWSGRK